MEMHDIKQINTSNMKNNSQCILEYCFCGKTKIYCNKVAYYLCIVKVHISHELFKLIR